MPTNEAVVSDMDRVEIVVPRANGEDVFPSIIGKMDFGKAKG
jgi:hypothetical protein